MHEYLFQFAIPPHIDTTSRNDDKRVISQARLLRAFNDKAARDIYKDLQKIGLEREISEYTPMPRSGLLSLVCTEKVAAFVRSRPEISDKWDMDWAHKLSQMK